MRLPLVLLTASLLVIPTCRAQTASAQNRQSSAEAPHFSVNSDQLLAQIKEQALACPVSLQVHHGAGDGQLVATADRMIRPAPQALDLIVANRGFQDIARVEAVVQMASGRVQLMPTEGYPIKEGGQLAMLLDRKIGAGNEVAISWDVASSSPVRYVEVRKVTYRDGSTWSPLKHDPCRFKPDPMTLISER